MRATRHLSRAFTVMAAALLLPLGLPASATAAAPPGVVDFDNITGVVAIDRIPPQSVLWWGYEARFSGPLTGITLVAGTTCTNSCPEVGVAVVPTDQDGNPDLAPEHVVAWAAVPNTAFPLDDAQPVDVTFADPSSVVAGGTYYVVVFNASESSYPFLSADQYLLIGNDESGNPVPPNTHIRVWAEDQMEEGVYYWVDFDAQAGVVFPMIRTYVLPSYSIYGFTQPLNDPTVAPQSTRSVYKAGSTIPVKFQLRYEDGSLVDDTTAAALAASCDATLQVTKASASGASLVVDEASAAVRPTTDGCFRYDATSHQLVYNLATAKADAQKMLTLTATVGDVTHVLGGDYAVGLK